MQIGENMDNLSKEQLILLVKEMNNKMTSLQEEVNFYKEQISSIKTMEDIERIAKEIKRDLK